MSDQLPNTPWNREFSKGFPTTGNPGSVVGPTLTSVGGGSPAPRTGWYVSHEMGKAFFFDRGQRLPGDNPTTIWLLSAESPDATREDILDALRESGWRGNFNDLEVVRDG